MRVDKLRGEFSVFVVGDIQSLDLAKASRRLIEAGYQPQFLELGPQLLIRARQDAPHIVLFHLSSPAVFDAIRELLVLSSEIKCIVMATESLAGSGSVLLQGGVFDILDRIDDRWDELVPRVDRAVEQWIFQIRSEESKKDLSEAEERMASLAEKKNKVVPTLHPSIQHYLEFRSGVQDGDELFGILTQAVSSLFESGQTLLFRYMPSFRQMSLFSSNAASARGIGLKLSATQDRERDEFFANLSEYAEFSEMMRTVWHCRDYKVWSSREDDGSYTVVVALHPKRDAHLLETADLILRLFTEDRKHYSTVRQLHATADKDPITGAILRRELRPRIDLEISRSRRLNLPLSVALCRIDRFAEYQAQFGKEETAQLCRRVGRLILKTCRCTDLVLRNEDSEFVILLPHTDLKGGAIKAEKLRRLIEKTPLAIPGDHNWGSITISAGVSSFPNPCADADTLLEAADQALAHVVGGASNRVCVSARREELER